VARSSAQVSQVFLNIAYPLAPARQEEMSQQRWRLVASLAANLFGGGMSAPVVDTVREQLGLAYTAHSTMDSGDGGFHAPH
jgi:predicted Zn-dependent peptidase